MRALNTPDGLALVLHPELAPTGAARGSVLIVHGLGEHAGRYAHVAAAVAAQGWAVARFDQRGHGLSAGPRGGLRDDLSLLSDLGLVVADLRARRPGPLLLLGHSLGGLVVSRFVAEGLAAAPAAWWQAVDGLVMSSPALDPGMNAGQKALLSLLGLLLPNLAVGNGLQADWVCSDPAVVRAYRADPLVHSRITPRLVRFLVQAGVQVRSLAARWTTPSLLLYAGADRCVARRGSDAFVASAPPLLLQVRCYDTLAHEIFNEPEQAQVLDDLTAWLAQRWPRLDLAPPAAG